MSDSDLRARLAEPGGGWRGLTEELRQSPELESSLAALETLAGCDPEVDVRYKARKVLSALGAGRARSAPSGEPPPPLGTLSAALERAEPAQRGALLERFAQAHRAHSVDEILPMLATESDPQVLSVAARLVGQYGNAGHFRDLRPLLAHANSRVVANAVEAMGRCDAGAALPAVLPALMAEDHRVRANVLIVLYASSKEEVMGYLSRMATSPHESYRAAAIWCLSQIHDPDGDTILISILKADDSPEVLDSAQELLEKIGTPATLPPLRRFSEEVPARRDRAMKIVDVIAQRCGLAGPELEEAMGPSSASRRLVGTISGEIKRIRKSLQVRVLDGVMRSSRRITTRMGGRRRRFRLALIGLSCLACALVCIYRGTLTSSPSSRWTYLATSPRPVAAKSPRAGRKGQLRLVGKVSSRVGATLVMKQDYTVYTVRFRDARQLANVRAGQTVSVNARYRTWNPALGYVELDAAGAPGNP